MPLINWQRLMDMEGETVDVSLLPLQASLLIKMLWFLEDNPQDFIEDADEIDLQELNDTIDAIESVLGKV